MEQLKVEVVGLAALQKGLKAIDANAPKELRLALNSGAQLLVDEARPKIPEVTGAAARSLVARSTRTSARVAVGGKKAPWFPWLDFGGEGRIAGRPTKREFLKEGRYIYPTLREIRPQIIAQLQTSISDLIRNAGLQED